MAELDDAMKAINRRQALMLYATKTGNYSKIVSCLERISSGGKSHSYSRSSGKTAFFEQLKRELMAIYDWRSAPNPFIHEGLRKIKSI